MIDESNDDLVPPHTNEELLVIARNMRKALGASRSPTASPDQDFLKLLDELRDADAAYFSWTPTTSPPGWASEIKPLEERVQAARQSLVDYVEGIRAERNEVLNALIECGVNAGGYGLEQDITVEVPKAVAALREDVLTERITPELTDAHKVVLAEAVRVYGNLQSVSYGLSPEGRLLEEALSLVLARRISSSG